jgi:tRNA dimethylallyltransferase
VGGTGLYLQAITDGLEIPGQFPSVRAELDADGDTAALFGRLEDLDPVAAGRMEPTNRRRVVRALEVTLGSGRPFSSFGPGLDSYPPSPFPIVGLDIDRGLLDTRIERRYAAQIEAGFVAEVERLLGRPAGLSRTARQALGYAELLDHLEHGTPLDDAVEHAVRRTRRFARRQQRWFGRDPRIEWVPVGDSERGNALARLDGILRD